MGDAVLSERVPISELKAPKNERLLVDWNVLFILNLALERPNRVTEADEDRHGPPSGSMYESHVNAYNRYKAN